MGFWGSILGAGIGWWTLGPIGAIMGLVFGHLSEEQNHFLNGNSKDKATQTRNGFLASLLILVGAVMKADGKVLRSELDYVKASLVATFGETQAGEALILLRNILKQDIPLSDVIQQIRKNINYSSRLQLFHLLYGIALADGHFSEEEKRLLRSIAQGLGVSDVDYESIKATFGNDLSSCYKVLEIDESASDEEVKKAYRKMAVRFHPDKVAQLGDDIRITAEEKFKKVNEAYERIKSERKIK